MNRDPSLKERSFSVELKSIANLKHVIIANSSKEDVLIEGTIGKLQSADYSEGILLELVGENGVLRVDLVEADMNRSFEAGVKKQ